MCADSFKFKEVMPAIARAWLAGPLALGLVCVPSAALAQIRPSAGLSIAGSIVAVLATVVRAPLVSSRAFRERQ